MFLYYFMRTPKCGWIMPRRTDCIFSSDIKYYMKHVPPMVLWMTYFEIVSVDIVQFKTVARSKYYYRTHCRHRRRVRLLYIILYFSSAYNIIIISFVGRADGRAVGLLSKLCTPELPMFRGAKTIRTSEQRSRGPAPWCGNSNNNNTPRRRRASSVVDVR